VLVEEEAQSEAKKVEAGLAEAGLSQAAQVEKAHAEAQEPQPKSEESTAVAEDAKSAEAAEITSTAPEEANMEVDQASTLPGEIARASGLEPQTPAAVAVTSKASDAAEAGEVAEPAESPESKAAPKLSRAERRRSSAMRPASLEVMAAKIKRLKDEADEAEAAIEAEVAKLRALEAKIASMRVEAKAIRALAHRAEQDYVRKECEASIAHLETLVPKRPPAPFFIFSREVQVKGVRILEQSAEISKKWKQLSAEEKQVYFDKHEALIPLFRNWSQSEEGKKNLAERSELIKRSKATSKEELDQAIDGIAPKSGAVATPVKRSRSAEAMTPEPPAKQRRQPPAKDSPVAGPALDEKILEEAAKSNWVVQLRNLAARPDVQAMGKTSDQLWQALKASNGMVNAAKHALLSA